MNGLGDPLILILVGFINQSVGLDVTVEVIADEIVVAVIGDGTSKSGESTGVTEGSFINCFEDFGEVGIDGVGSVVVIVAEFFDILSEVTEKEDVISANLSGDFDL